MEGRIAFKIEHNGDNYEVEFFTEGESIHLRRDRSDLQIVPIDAFKERAAVNQTDNNLYFVIYDAILGISEKVDSLMTKR